LGSHTWVVHSPSVGLHRAALSQVSARTKRVRSLLQTRSSAPSQVYWLGRHVAQFWPEPALQRAALSQVRDVVAETRSGPHRLRMAPSHT